MQAVKQTFLEGTIRKKRVDWGQKTRSLVREESFGLAKRKHFDKWTEIRPVVPRQQVLFCRLEYSELDIEETFRRLVEEWRTATLLSSSMTEMCMHPAYVRIIGLGRPVVPLLLRELLTNPDHWFWALFAITGANPVNPSDAGDLARMTEAWIRWGKTHGYI